jgi:hypothetical protein
MLFCRRATKRLVPFCLWRRSTRIYRLVLNWSESNMDHTNTKQILRLSTLEKRAEAHHMRAMERGNISQGLRAARWCKLSIPNWWKSRFPQSDHTATKAIMLNDDDVWPVPCPNCGKMKNNAIGQLKCTSSLTCDSCGAKLQFYNDVFADAVDNLRRTVDLSAMRGHHTICSKLHAKPRAGRISVRPPRIARSRTADRRPAALPCPTLSRGRPILRPWPTPF